MNYLLILANIIALVASVPVLGLFDGLAHQAAHYVPPAMPKAFASEIPSFVKEESLLKSASTMSDPERDYILQEFDKLDKEAQDLEDLLKVIGAKIDAMEKRKADKIKALEKKTPKVDEIPAEKKSSLVDRVKNLFATIKKQ